MLKGIDPLLNAEVLGALRATPVTRRRCRHSPPRHLDGLLVGHGLDANLPGLTLP